MSKWNDRKKKDDEQNAQIEKPEESAVKDYSAHMRIPNARR